MILIFRNINKIVFMKTLMTLLLISFSCTVLAQKALFVRVYDLSGRKIYKGDVYATSDSALSIVVNKTPVNIPVSTIGTIKTKHSAGSNVIIGAAAGTVTFAILGAASADPDEFLGYTAGEGAAAGALIGAPLGAAIGSLTILLKNSRKFLINGDPAKWETFRSFVSEKNGASK
jgi:hypothetical protein